MGRLTADEMSKAKSSRASKGTSQMLVFTGETQIFLQKSDLVSFTSRCNWVLHVESYPNWGYHKCNQFSQFFLRLSNNFKQKFKTSKFFYLVRSSNFTPNIGMTLFDFFIKNAFWNIFIFIQQDM